MDTPLVAALVVLIALWAAVAILEPWLAALWLLVAVLVALGWQMLRRPG